MHVTSAIIIQVTLFGYAIISPAIYLVISHQTYSAANAGMRKNNKINKLDK